MCSHKGIINILADIAIYATLGSLSLWVSAALETNWQRVDCSQSRASVHVFQIERARAFVSCKFHTSMCTDKKYPATALAHRNWVQTRTWRHEHKNKTLSGVRRVRATNRCF